MTRIWAALIASLWMGAVSAQEVKQEFKPDPVDEAAAKREGKVTWYTSTPVAAGQYIANEFERRTGIKVEMLRTGGQNVIRRFMQEADGGRINVDVITMSDMSKQWIDLTLPKYKGQLVMADPSFTAIQLMVVATLSRKFGWQFYEGLRKNDTLIVQGHEQVYDMLKRGERVIAAESADPRVYNDGKPLPNMRTIASPDGTIVVPSPSAVVKGSPHPNAAKLFAQFNMSV